MRDADGDKSVEENDVRDGVEGHTQVGMVGRGQPDWNCSEILLSVRWEWSWVAFFLTPKRGKEQ